MQKLANGLVTITIAAGLVLMAAAWTGCGAAARERTLNATLVAVNAARDGFIEHDRLTQTAIVDAAATREAAVAELAAYRKKREPVIEAFTATYRALAIAAVLEDDPTSLGSLLFTAKQLAAILESFGCKLCAAVPK